MGKRGEVTSSAPSKLAEIFIELLVPPACREEVLGDLHERYTTRQRYFLDAVSVVPLVILSRIRRVADPQVLLMEAMVLYLSFTAGAWFQDRTFLHQEIAFLRSAIPAVIVVLASVVEDAYSTSGRRQMIKLFRGLVLGMGAAYLSQTVLSLGSGALALPRWGMLYGSGLGLLFASTLRIGFPPIVDRPLGAGGPAFWLKQVETSFTVPPVVVAIGWILAALLALAIFAAWVGNARVTKPIVAMVITLLIARELKKRS
jgi:hypothetical protein